MVTQHVRTLSESPERLVEIPAGARCVRGSLLIPSGAGGSSRSLMAAGAAASALAISLSPKPCETSVWERY